jgi:RNA polymerase sigma factor (sigma-70 family)
MNGLPVANVAPVALAASSADRLSELFDAHHERLYRLARRLVADADEALDLVQETFLRAARSPRAVPSGRSDEEAWLVRVLINIRRDQWRKAAVRERHNPTVSHSGGTGVDSETALLARITVWRALDTLPPRRRAVVVMHELDGLPIPAVASLLGISTITVRWHLCRGRRELARHLRPLPGGPDEDA